MQSDEWAGILQENNVKFSTATGNLNTAEEAIRLKVDEANASQSGRLRPNPSGKRPLASNESFLETLCSGPRSPGQSRTLDSLVSYIGDDFSVHVGSST